MTRYAKRLDGNQRQLDDLARKLGAAVLHASAAPDIGFDRVLVRGGIVYIVEVKDGSLSPSHRQLTEGEQKAKKKIEDAGGTYWIIQSEDDLFRMFGLI